MIKNQSGQITVDFLFAIVLVLGFTALLFSMSFTLMVASVTQYVTFSAARNYQAANVDQASQEKAGQDKYHELISNSVLKPLYSNGWYKVDADSTIGDGTQTFSQYQGSVNEFWGVGTHFVAPILDFKIPFFGSTVPDGDGQGLGFTTYLASYLGREPSDDECIKFTANRWTNITNMTAKSGNSNYSQAQGKYFPQEDNGC